MGPQQQGPQQEYMGPQQEYMGPQQQGPQQEYMGPQQEYMGPQQQGPQQEYMGPQQEYMGPADARTLNEAYDRFVATLTANPSTFHPAYEQFAPAILAGVRVAFRVIPPLRNAVVNLIARLLERMLGRFIPKNIGDLAYRPMASMLLRLMGFEAQVQNQALENRVFAEAIANTTTEALIAASHLPQSILEGDQRVLESELEGIVQEAILNNLPTERMGLNIPRLPRRPGQVVFVPRRGGYQSLSRAVRVTLNPNEINTVRITRPEFLGHFLRRHYRWDGRSPLSLDIMVFRTTRPGARLFRILRGYFGAGRPIQLRPFHFRQLHRMTRRAARILKIPWLWNRNLATYYIIRRVTPIGAGAIVSSPSTTTTPIPASAGTAPTRGNEIKAGLDSLGRLRVWAYLNDETVKRLSTMGLTAIRSLGRLLNANLPVGQAWLTNLLRRLRIPHNFARAASNLLIRLVRSFLNRSASGIISRLRNFARSTQGVTIEIVVQLPRDIVRTLMRTNPLQLPGLIRSIINSHYSVALNVGYRL
jgi:hypothetical protein